MKTLLVLLVMAAQMWAQQPASPAKTDKLPTTEINTVLMESTFRIEGPSALPGEENKTRFGAGFVMLRLVKQDSDAGQFVLVTAKHVLEGIKGDTAILTLRRRSQVGDIQLF